MKVKELMLKCEGLEQRNLEMVDEKWELRGKLRKAEAKLEKYEYAIDVKQKYIEKLEKEIEELKTLEQEKEEKEFWKNKAMTLLFQVRRLTPRMTNDEIAIFTKELEEI